MGRCYFTRDKDGNIAGCNIDDSKFIFLKNFLGDPAKDEKFGSSERQANIVISDPDFAEALRKEGVNVKNYTFEGDDAPTYFVKIAVNFNAKWPPRIFLEDMENDTETELDERSIGIIDENKVKNVTAKLNLYENNKGSGKKTLYVHAMYVELDKTDTYDYRKEHRKALEEDRESMKEPED